MINRENLLQTIRESILEIFPTLSSTQITEEDSLKNLGANSIDRAEIIMLTLGRLQLKVPLVLFAPAKNIGALIDIFDQELQTQN
jgi:polyketide biosynthesis acyl carrier protein